MKSVKILGSDAVGCQAAEQLIAEVAKSKGLYVEIERVETIKEMMSFGVLTTPGIVVDGKVVHSGSVPGREQVEGWLGEEKAGGCCGSCC
ncbi:MAG: thioredoxin family protein [Gammaproteobacteria bacterium]|nr:thioredoxin family protein [Gammaproteobacteria bacterium]